MFSSLHCVEGRNIVLDSITWPTQLFFTVQNEFQLVLLLLDSLFSWWQIFYFFNYTAKDSVSWLKSDYMWWIRRVGVKMVLANFKVYCVYIMDHIVWTSILNSHSSFWFILSPCIATYTWLPINVPDLWGLYLRFSPHEVFCSVSSVHYLECGSFN